MATSLKHHREVCTGSSHVMPAIGFNQVVAMMFAQPTQLVIAGPIGAGKSTVSRLLHDKHGFDHLSYVERVWKPILQERGLPPTRTNLQILGAELLDSIGPEKLAKTILPHITREPFVIDDIRSPTVYESLKDELPDLRLLYINVDNDIRRRRAATRDSNSLREQIEAERYRTETEIRDLRTYSSYDLTNDGNLDHLAQQIARIVNSEST